MSRPPSRILGDPQPKLDEIKLHLCVQIERICWRNGWTITEMAIRCGTSKACISYAINKRIKRLTISQLIRYLALTAHHLEILVSI